MRTASEERLLRDNEFPSLPDSWRVERFRFLFRESKERNGRSPVGEMLSVSEYRGVTPRIYDHQEQRRTDEELENYRVVRPGQLAVNTMWLNHLGLGVSDNLGHVSPAYSVYEVSDRLDRRFVHHLLRSQFYLKIYLRYLYGIRPNSFQIKADDWNSIPVVVPDLDTQKAIADVLDKETARIDQLIEKKQRLVALLGEKANAEVDAVVSSGLDRSRPMQPTSLPWLPEVPSDWCLVRAKYLFNLVDEPPKDDDEIITAFRDGQVTLRRLRRTEGYTFAIKEVGYQHIQAGDLVVHSMDAFAGAIGVSERSGKATGEYVVLRGFSNDVNHTYFAHLLRCMAKRDYVHILCPSVRQRAPRFRYPRIAPVELPLPPSAEQEAVVEAISGTRERISRVARPTKVSIDRLKEYRSALITAAVTGQIDVIRWGQTGEGDKRLDQIQEEMAG